MRRLGWPSLVGVLLASALDARVAGAADWPQFMRSGAHSGDAADETLRLPLGLTTCVQLDDAVTTAPAVVGGKVYVVDQMGTAYCIDPVANRIVWKTAPDGKNARGGNTSSACVAGGRVVFGTTAGRLHVLDARSGDVVRSVDLQWPITGSPTFANGSIYLQTVGAHVHCFDLDGKERWRWDHYGSYVDPKTNKLATGFPGSYHDPHYAGGEIATAGKRLVVNMGWDLYCLEDTGAKPQLVWCNRAPMGKDPGIPMGAAISGEWVHCGHPGTDQFGGFMRVKLADGAFDPKKDFRTSSYPGSVWAVFATPAVRGTTAYVPTHFTGMHAWDGEAKRVLWATSKDSTADRRRSNGVIASPALTREHCVFGTVSGELHVVALESNAKPAPFTFKTPFGRPIASAPAIADGVVYFGCDDGYLYGLAPDGKRPLPTEMADLHTPRSKVEAATGKRYGAPVASMDQGNTCCVDDARLKPPLRLRWAQRPFDLRVQIGADDDSVYFISEAGTCAAIEQATGRIRWRQRLNGPIDGWKQLLLDRGVLYVTRGSGRPSDTKPEDGGASFSAFDAATGKLLWQNPWGGLQGTCRASPVIVGDVVAGIAVEGKPGKMIVTGFERTSGKPRWRVELPGNDKTLAGGGCVLDGVMFFSCGQSWDNGPGSTAAIEPATGKVLWKTEEYHIHGYGRPSARDGLLYLGGQYNGPMYCVSARDGTLKWKAENVPYSHNPALGQDYFVTRGYSGGGILRDLANGKPVVRDGKQIQGGCPDHACSPVLLTTGRISYAVSSSGMYARDVETGKVVWQSLGFAPRACTTPIAANGRLFFSPNVNNALYCFEPAP